MSFDYDHIVAKNDNHGSWWTSYADLFMMLSIVFLLMYVASSLRSGTAGYQQQIEQQKLVKRAGDLEEQIKVYNTLKDEALRKQATEEEQQVYQKLMSKLTLLQDEAHSEKLGLEKKAKENQEKEFALNQYQQLIRNIINTNILAKTQIQHRDKLIVTKDATIEEKKAKIQEMEKTVSQNQVQIDSINSQLSTNIQKLRDEQKRSKMSQMQLEQKVAVLRLESAKQVKNLEDSNKNISTELSQVKGTLVETETRLGEATQTIQEKEKTNTVLAAKLEKEREDYMDQMKSLQAEHRAKLATERAVFDANMKKQRLTLAEREKRTAQFVAAAKQKEAELEGSLNGLRGKIQEAENKLRGTEEKLAGAEAEKERALASIENLKREHSAKMAAERAAFDANMKKLHLSAAEKERRTSAFLAQAKQKEGELQGKLAGLRGKIQDAEGKLAGTEAQLQGTRQKLAGTEAEKSRALAAVQNLQGDLERTRAIANARKTLAKKILSQFEGSGLKGAVDGKTGEVTLDFGEEYFDTGSTNLKPAMRVTLDKFIPLYAQSLFNDPKIAEKIANVEIVGFASSTYRGRYVNPKSSRPEDKAAIEYNLKLSFGRANSIFSHVLNQGRLTKEDRERLLPLMKVVGRGYLPDGRTPAEIPYGMKESEFCAKYNCKKAQRVIVKFNMKD